MAGPDTIAPRSSREARSLREGLRLIGYFLRYVRADLGLVLGVILLSVLLNLLRLPLLYLPAVLMAHLGAPGGIPPGEITWPGGAVLAALRVSFGTPGYLMAFVVLAFAGVLLIGPLQLLRSYWSGLFGTNLLLRLRVELFQNLRRLDMLAVYERGAGPFVHRLTRDLFVLHELFVFTLVGLVNLAVQIGIYLGAMLSMETRLTLLVLLAYGVLQPVLLLFNRRIELQATRLQELHEGVTTKMLESVGGYRDILATGRFDHMAGQFRARSEELRRETLRALLWSGASELLLSVAFGLLAVVPYFVILERLSRIDQLGRLVTYVGLLSSLLPSLAGLWGATIDFAVAAPSLHALRQLLTHPVSSAPAPAKAGEERREPSSLPHEVRRIRFEGVGLWLQGRWIVRELTFEVVGQKLTALIGPSGSGKTTIFHLLLRLLTPTCGTISIDDTPLPSFGEAELRRLVGFIPQSPFIFNASLRENLWVLPALPGRPKPRIEEVLRAAQLEDLVRGRSQEGGLDSSAGYLGMRLSGGERQRLALGRLLAQDPQIIVCDEYTANLDVATARLIQDMMRTRFADRTRLIITHELYNARGADEILVLDHGRIVQSGTHAELVAIPGVYRSMWEIQRLD
jgi:ABC-type multidrug transport system fused ATPase/permease subunit